MHLKYPKILIVSNNPLSETNNNGKTIASFFKGFPSDRLSQLYFSEDVPDVSVCSRYFQLSDSHILKSLLHTNSKCGCRVTPASNNGAKNRKSTLLPSFQRVLKGDLGRLMREAAWAMSRCRNEALFDWVDRAPPDVIFFMAGDSCFAYDIVGTLKRRYGAALVTFITDDYALPRRSFSIFWWIRRALVLERMRESIVESRSLVTISEKMRLEYAQLFGRDSTVAFNIPDQQVTLKGPTSEKAYIELVYAGGLHFSRWKTLQKLADAIKHFNATRKHGKLAHLKIYTNEKPDRRVRSKIELPGAASYEGSLTKEQLEIVLSKADVLVHAESFDRRCIESTRLSVSTKISEYLALKRPILAIGPMEVASMEFLKDTACCATSEKMIDPALRDLLGNEAQRECWARKAGEKWRAVSMQYGDALVLQKRLFGVG